MAEVQCAAGAAVRDGAPGCRAGGHGDDADKVEGNVPTPRAPFPTGDNGTPQTPAARPLIAPRQPPLRWFKCSGMWTNASRFKWGGRETGGGGHGEVGGCVGGPILGHITPAAWSVPTASERGAESQVAHKWARWLHNPCRLGGPHRGRQSQQ